MRTGIVGGGFMATVHSRAARAAGSEIVAIASSNPDRARRAAAELGIAHAADSVDELLADPGIDVVHVCTPNSTHVDLATRVLRAGKHVVCEKPLATSTTDAAELVELAARSGLVAAVPFVYRYHPMVQELRARVAGGELGRLITVQGAYLQDWLLEEGDDDWRVGAAGGGSRAFADIGSHLVDLLEFVTGERIASLHATTSIVHPVRGGAAVTTEDVAAVAVRFDRGAIGTLLVSQTAAGHDNDLRIEVMGTATAMSFVQQEPEALRIGRRGSVTLARRGFAGASGAAQELSLVPGGHPMGYQDAFNAFVRDVHAAIGGDLRERMPAFADGARMVRVTDAVLDSAASAAWVGIDGVGVNA
ncbi:putative dehydrogenase [Agromyces terreus]|uniref:Dehydrogenase n=1 Tax=Agromyces terreus TaxID=424795 RepID=A0A9X2KD19_9MICO|nr:Gfo/Idh/MocA family oxidoreductase [Agromyces terreus]MCP2371845.1 putative dehydrogenase [Agromyces terreus]